jgi:hypothetical protein
MYHGRPISCVAHVLEKHELDCIKVAGLGNQELDPKRRFTPFIVLLERVVLDFADRGEAFKQRTLDGCNVSSQKESYWLFIADLLRRHDEELQKEVRDCNVTPDNINVYAGGDRIPNVLSFLHLTYEILRNQNVCPPG